MLGRLAEGAVDLPRVREPPPTRPDPRRPPRDDDDALSAARPRTAALRCTRPCNGGAHRRPVRTVRAARHAPGLCRDRRSQASGWTPARTPGLPLRGKASRGRLVQGRVVDAARLRDAGPGVAPPPDALRGATRPPPPPVKRAPTTRRRHEARAHPVQPTQRRARSRPSGRKGCAPAGRPRLELRATWVRPRRLSDAPAAERKTCKSPHLARDGAPSLRAIQHRQQEIDICRTFRAL